MPGQTAIGCQKHSCTTYNCIDRVFSAQMPGQTSIGCQNHSCTTYNCNDRFFSVQMPGQTSIGCQKHSCTTYNCIDRIFLRRCRDQHPSVASILVFDFYFTVAVYVFLFVIYMLCSIVDAVISDCWPILSEVLTLNDAVCIALLHLSYICLCLSFVADFSDIRLWAPTSAKGVTFFTHEKGDMVWTHGLSESHGYHKMAVF